MKYKNKSGTLISLKVDASNVNEDAQHRFVSDTEKNTYDGKVTALGGDLSNTKINNFDSVTTEFPIPEPGETTKTILGKMRKFLQDFNTFKTNIITLSKLANNLTTTSVGMALDARQGKVLKDEINTLNGSLNIIGTFVNGSINKNVTFVNTKESILGKIQLSKGVWIITATASVQGASAQKGIIVDVSISGINTNSLMVPDIYKWDTKALVGIVSGGDTFNISAAPYGNLDMDQVRLIGLNAVRIK